MIPACIRAAGLAVAVAACGHGDAFRVVRYDSDVPVSPGNPARLTINPGVDDDPSWLGGGSGIVYAFANGARDDGDICLAILPPTGGRALRVLCDNSPAQWDSTNTFAAPAVSPDGQVAFVRFGAGLRLRFPRTIDLMVGSFDDLAGARRVASVPYTLPGAPTHLGVSQIRWLGPRALVYRGDWRGNVCVVEVPDCETVGISSGLNLVYHPLDSVLGARRVLPGTAYASSVAAGADPDELYFTRGGDSRAYRYVVSTGVRTVVYDFGAIARDVQFAAGRLVAVVGGAVVFENRPGAGLVQVDFGGALVAVDLASGVPTTVGTGAYRHPALAPDGRRLVAERYGDLWLFTLP